MCGVNRIVCKSLCLEVKQNKDNRQNSSTLGWRIWILHQNCKWLTDWLTVAPLLVSVRVGCVHSDRWAGTPLPQLCGDQSGAAALALVVTVSALDSQESLWASRWKRFGGTGLFFPPCWVTRGMRLAGWRKVHSGNIEFSPCVVFNPISIEELLCLACAHSCVC